MPEEKKPLRLTRRTLIRHSAASLGLAGAGSLCSSRLVAALQPPATPATTSSSVSTRPTALHRFPRLVQDFLVTRVRDRERIANLRRAALRTADDAKRYVNQVRRDIADCFGPLPEKTPLNAKIHGRLERETYAIEKITFESRPQFLVTGNLYLPKRPGHRLPAIVGSCGHYPEAKAAEPYQSFAQSLARFGYVVLLFDPIGQGERLQYLNENLRSRISDNGVREHLQVGNQQLLVGEHLAAWRAWDGIRAVDYLLTRPEVDPSRIGITGNSGGGTDTTWLCGLDDRLSMAAPECFVTTVRRNLENELPIDSEQCPPRMLALDLDHADFIAAMAPKPVILIGQEKDFFDARGLEEAYDRVRKIYRLLGAEDRIKLVIESDFHSYTRPSREAMYRWFNYAAGIDAAETEPALKLETAEDLRCTPRGQVGAMGSRSAQSFTREKSSTLAASRKVPEGEAFDQMIVSTLRLPSDAGPPEYRILRPEKNKSYAGFHAGVYFVETEPPAGAIVYRLNQEPLYSRPPKSGKRALLYVSDRSADAELRSNSNTWLRSLISAEPVVFACDPRGVGESQPNTCGRPFDDGYGADYLYAAFGAMLDYPYVTQKTYDVLTVLTWLKAHGHDDIHLAASGWGSVPATFAAVLCPQVKQVTLQNALGSFSEIAESDLYTWPLSTFVPGILKHFDLPDCYRRLESKGLKKTGQM